MRLGAIALMGIGLIAGTALISQNLDTFLKGTTCTDMLAKINDESLSPTLNFLTTSLKFSPNKSENEYDTYIENHMYLYQMEKGNTQIVREKLMEGLNK